MVLSIKAAAHADYYFQATGLETLPEYANGVWYGRPKGAGLGVRPGQPISPRDLDCLLRRRAISGERPTFGRTEGSTGRDFVFSAPKSVSIFWAFGLPATQKAIEEAQVRAVKSAIDVFLAEACRERCGKGGVILKPADTVVAIFNHIGTRLAAHAGQGTPAELRFQDPNLHTHVVVPDLVINAEGRLKVGFTAMHRHWSMALGAWYHAMLAAELRKAGFVIQPTGLNGLFQIADRNDPPENWRPWSEWIVAFSARTYGNTGVLTRTGPLLERFMSKEVGDEELHLDEIEKRRARAEFEAALKRTRQALARLEPELLTELWKRHAARIGEIRHSLVFEPQPRKAVAALDKTRESRLFEDAVADASASTAVLQTQDLVRALASRLVADHLDMRPSWALVDRLQADPTLLTAIKATQSYNLRQWTTPTIEALEKGIASMVGQLTEIRRDPQALVQRTSADLSRLNDDQRRHAELALSSQRLTVITGAPGTGKTELLGPVIRAFRRQGSNFHVVGAAEAWQPALALKAKFDIPAFSLAQLFHQGLPSSAVDPANPKDAKSRERRIPIGTKTLLIVDEAGLLPTKRMHAVLDCVLKRGAKLILLGDDGQLSPIGAGSGLRLVQGAMRSGARPLTTLMRQNPSPFKTIVEGLIDLRTASIARSGLLQPGSESAAASANLVAETFLSSGTWASHKNSHLAVEMIMAPLLEQMKSRDPQKGSLIALARSHREIQHITRQLRIGMRAANLLEGPDVAVRAVTPMGVTAKLQIAKGERIRFLVRNQRLGVFNGTTATVVGIEMIAAEPRLSVIIDDERSPRAESFAIAEFFDDHGRARIAPAYAGTVYGGQGMTVDNVIVLRSAAMTFRELYVAITRARFGCRIVEVNAKRAFLAKCEATTPATRQAIRISIARELLSIARRDQVKANAMDHRIDAVAEHREPSQPWLWEALFEERSNGWGGVEWGCNPISSRIGASQVDQAR